MGNVFIEIRGEPIAQGRPRAFRRGSFIGMYDPKKSSTWKDSIRMQAINQKAEMLDGALKMEVRFFLSRPKSLPKKVRHHVKKPDIDNLLKSVKDALKSICYHDDSQICLVVASKEYVSEQRKPGVAILITEIDN